MDQTEFRRLLFRVAFCTMACDGHIDANEIEEIKAMNKKATFFDAIDLSEELTRLIAEFKLNGTKVVEDLFQSLKQNDFNMVEELLILEVALRIINADSKHDENELKFLHLLRSKLELHDETITDRFGKLDVLHTSNRPNDMANIPQIRDIRTSIDLPVLKEFDASILKL